MSSQVEEQHQENQINKEHENNEMIQSQNHEIQNNEQDDKVHEGQNIGFEDNQMNQGSENNQGQYDNSQQEQQNSQMHNEASQQENEENLISILNFNPENHREPILNSPRSLMACQITGINPKMLIKKTPEEMYKTLKNKSNLNEQGLKMLSENQEKRRLEKVQEVIKARENIINDNLTRDDKKILQQSIMLKNNSIMQSQYKSETNFDSQQRSFYHPTENQSMVSQVVNAKLQKTKYLQRREIENMIGNEMRTYKLLEESNKKDQRLLLISQQKEVIRQRRRIEFEENQLVKKQNLEKLRQQDAQMRIQKEQEYQKKQEASNHNLQALKSMIQRFRKDESDRKVVKSQIALSTIAQKDEQKRYQVEKKYLEKEEKFQQRQQLFQQYIQRVGQKRDEKGERAIEKYNKQNQDNFQRLEKKRMQQEQKQRILEERQKMIEQIRQTQIVNKINENLHKDSRIKSANNLKAMTMSSSNQEFMSQLDREEQRKHERDIIRERIIQEKLMEKRIKEEEILNKKQLLVQTELTKRHEKYLLKERAATEKANNLQNQKKWFFQTQSNLKLMKLLNAQENIQRIQNQQENKKAIINERLQQFEDRRRQREQEQKDALYEKETILRQTEVAKQTLKRDLNKLFQTGKEINVEKISKKYNIPLDSEEQIMSRSMVDFDRPTRELQSSHSPTRNLHTSQQGQRHRSNNLSKNQSEHNNQHEEHYEV
ncbi:hypothetical protein TTHERM_00136460 (macronuclear) [Tetrahymena thermophila SB210]|uniref:Uncharacterized protein n=1 Tax=Tetrahymena thermophila (strain SB210) TaxID=312017 RepID=I7MF84_TETTS|nr:hypothetical protein TTHERM_00136460 [Tetrahymena thermophila SB210]EAR99482.2 hypothetical protein TTHERM_00136460 [Tetrahymena thermophila SB210]|eukprot:XP_001019727.2 hypothetical protein TTHERM_00136460 [Tetrahymena thermophila SB210]